MPGTRHAKNNTALGFFTKYERDRLEWGTKRVRLGKDSIKKFDACTICLKLCSNPVMCPRGDLFCKECIYESLLTQKHRIKKQMIEYETFQVETEQKKEEKNRKKEIDQFMKFDKLETSLVLDNIARKEENSMIYSKESNNNNNNSNNNSNSNDSKSNLNNSNNINTTEKNEKSQLNDSNPRDKQLGCFWIPQLTPNTKNSELSSNGNSLKPKKLHCYCPACNQKIRLKDLIKVRFTLATHGFANDSNNNKQKSKTKTKTTKTKQANANGSFRSGLGATIQSVSVANEKRFVCPCCEEILTNTMKIACLKQCGHVLCLKCVAKFVGEV